MARKLSDKQQRFVDAYLIEPNATRAAIKAGYSKKSARQIGEQNLSKLDISAAIEAARNARKERTKIDADLVLQGLLEEAQDHGKNSSHAARVAAWTQLAKHLGLFEKNNAQKKYGPEDLAALRTRLEACGFDFRIKNLPPGCVQDEQGRIIRPTPAPSAN